MPKVSTIRGVLSDLEREYLDNFNRDVSPRTIELKLALYDWLKSNIITQAENMKFESQALIADNSKTLERLNLIIKEFCD